MGIIRRMGKEGDVPTRWEVGDEGQIQIARERFDECIRKGGLAFNLDSDPGERIREFDPNAKENVLMPQIAGG